MTILRIKKISLPLLLMLFAYACSKNNAYEIKDGTPNDGQPVPVITVDTNVKNVDVSKYAQARVFPGLVCATEPRGT